MDGDYLRFKVASIPTIRSHTATFVRMVGGLAVINTGDTQITVPCVGYYPPVVGDTVQVEWRNGSPAVVGPAVPRNPIGTITGTGSPKAEVTVDGVAYLLPYRAGYTPTVSDSVEVNWATGVIQGALSEAPVSPEEPSSPGGGSASFDVTVLAAGSGKYDFAWSNWWGGSEVWASNNNQGIWWYGNAFRTAVGAGASISRLLIYLPLISQVGNCSIGVHAHPSRPGGAPTIGSAVPLSPRGGWVELPDSFATYLQAGGRGVGVTAPGGGLTKWRGAPSPDSRSGALRAIGTR